MITISVKCMACGKLLQYGTEQSGMDITIIPHDCSCKTIAEQIARINQKPCLCDICGKEVKGHNFAFTEYGFHHEACYPGGSGAYHQAEQDKVFDGILGV